VHRFTVFSHDQLIGETDLEWGDPPMGVAGGRFIPAPAYGAIQEAVRESFGSSQAALGLTVRTADGSVLPGGGSVSLEDSSDVRGPEAMEVSVLGIAYPAYEEWFPQHVAKYGRRRPS